MGCLISPWLPLYSLSGRMRTPAATILRDRKMKMSFSIIALVGLAVVVVIIVGVIVAVVAGGKDLTTSTNVPPPPKPDQGDE